ncbi:MAG: diphosphomevalonate decarboxylase [Lentisphaerota bacterium]
MTTRQDIVRRILKDRKGGPSGTGEAFAPSNIALCKYWGKRDEELNLPVTSSLSISLGRFGSRVTIAPCSGRDQFSLNGKPLDEDSSFSRRAQAFLDLFRPHPAYRFKLDAFNTIPTAAGFASSASGFAAVVMALDRLFGWSLSARETSILARLGSGSASRSITRGFVEWHAGKDEDGMDSFAELLEAEWPELRVGLMVICAEEKKVGSRAGMKQTVQTSTLYASWPAQVEQDLAALKRALREKDFYLLGRTAEANALAMHATMIATWPPVLYWKPESVQAMRAIWKLREEGLPVYFTMDAGPNLKLLFTEDKAPDIARAFPEVQIVDPWEK